MLNLKKLFKPNAEWNAAHALYAASVLAGRDPVFFGVWGVPDSAEGRFEALSMVAFLALRRLKQPPLPSSLGQAYFDIMFDDIDSNLREMGVGDIAVGKKVKKLAESFYGRIKAYDTGLDAKDDAALTMTLGKFLFRGVSPSAETLGAACAYMRAQSQHLADQHDAQLSTGTISFAPAESMRPS